MAGKQNSIKQTHIYIYVQTLSKDRKHCLWLNKKDKPNDKPKMCQTLVDLISYLSVSLIIFNTDR